MFLYLLILSIFSSVLAQTEAPDPFQCPRLPRTVNGTFPAGAYEPTLFPHGYSCQIQFETKIGFVLRFTGLNIGAGSMTAVTIASPRNLYSKTFNSNGAMEAYMPDGTSTMTIVTASRTNSTMYVSWEYIYVGNLSTTTYTSGQLVKTTMQPFQPISFVSYQPIQVGYAYFNPNTLVYNGSDLTSPFAGSLYNGINSMTGNLTFVVFSGESLAQNAFMAMRLEDISQYSGGWNLITPDIFSYMNWLSYDSAITIVSFTGSESYIKDVFPFFEIQKSWMSFEVRSGDPSKGADSMMKVLNYQNGTVYDSLVPQQVTSGLYTIISKGARFGVTISANGTGWDTVYPGRKGSIISASMWDDTASPNYNRSFTSPIFVVFNFNITQLMIKNPSEKLTISVGGNGPVISYEFTQQNQELFSKSINGTSMTVLYSGAPDRSVNGSSKFQVDFSITNLPVATTTIIPTSTASSTVITSSSSAASSSSAVSTSTKTSTMESTTKSTTTSTTTTTSTRAPVTTTAMRSTSTGTPSTTVTPTSLTTTIPSSSTTSPLITTTKISARTLSMCNIIAITVLTFFRSSYTF